MPDPSDPSPTDPPSDSTSLEKPVDPDRAEEEAGIEIDDVVPSRGYHTLPVVGLGGSAGGLTALRRFFENAGTGSGAAYVVILHLSPEHESSAAEILQRSTPMPVMQVIGPVEVKPDHVYVIPPGKHLSMNDGKLSLTEPERQRGRRVTVDFFFRSLADTHGPRATAIVLSGADGDGAIGIKRIKERGGLTVAQDPAEAEHDFSYYKRATVLRRIARRMQVNNTETLPLYLDFLRTHAGEAGALLQDLLISVTNFFRDRETFHALEALVPALFHDKRPEDEVRDGRGGLLDRDDAARIRGHARGAAADSDFRVRHRSRFHRLGARSVLSRHHRRGRERGAVAALFP